MKKLIVASNESAEVGTEFSIDLTSLWLYSGGEIPLSPDYEAVSVENAPGFYIVAEPSDNPNDPYLELWKQQSKLIMDGEEAKLEARTHDKIHIRALDDDVYFDLPASLAEHIGL